MRRFVRWTGIALVGLVSQSFALAQSSTGIQGPPTAGSLLAVAVESPAGHNSLSAVANASSRAAQDVQNPAASPKKVELPCRSTTAFTGEEIMNRREVQVESYRLFQAALAHKRVVPMWVTYKNGEFGFVRWPSSTGKRDMEVWKGPLPECTVAIIHTHSAGASNEPCALEHELANGRQRPSFTGPVYVLHRKGITKIVPGSSQVVTVRGSDWLREFAPTQAN
ncbi:MAG: hypothetical protein ACLGRW_06810 [Acidobacteriota bacterium]